MQIYSSICIYDQISYLLRVSWLRVQDIKGDNGNVVLVLQAIPEAELRDAVVHLCAAMEVQQAELSAMRQIMAAQEQRHTAELPAASPVTLASELRSLIGLMSSRTGNVKYDVVDGKSVGLPPRLADRKDDVAEWTHKRLTFLTAKLGDSLASLLKRAQQQNKTSHQNAIQQTGRYRIMP